jgi:hypothetical protein
MIEIEKLHVKLGEALGLEIAAQKAVEELDENRVLFHLQKMQLQAGNHQSKLEEVIHSLEAMNLIQQKFKRSSKRQLKSAQV